MTATPGGELGARIGALPDGGAVLVVPWAPGESEEEAAARAVRVARVAAEIRTHTFLAAFGTPALHLDRHFGASGPGLEAVFSGRSSLADVAVPAREEGDFIYLRSGTANAQQAREAPAAAARATRLARTLRRGGATLVLVVDEAIAARPEFDVPDHRTLGRDADLEASSGTPAVAAPSGRVIGTDRWRRHRKRKPPPVMRIVAGVIMLAATAGGWWLAVQYFGGSTGAPGPAPSASVAVADTVVGAGDTAAASGAQEASAPAEADAEPAAGRIAAEAPALPYSVLIASYARRADAVERARAWSRQDGTLYVVAPTPVQDRLYYRLFAGALPDRESAGRLMRELVDRGRKGEARAWDVRPTSLAFRLGVAGSRRRADALADSMRTAGVPTYVLPAVAGSDTTWQVYSGAFESEAAAAALESMIHKAGGEAHLVTRRGATG